ncbi:Pre-mRNA-splicing factor 38A like [Quillaja saponaria]|uniref:Pre-mRNA-splicing factor 38A like n=1 Tax=Quillaja saponaria TaxID=32244 RepID=A0AAD7LWA6_QUISA|nr:Pre-mRNA-splicing factor 38A like [Quillaja saponaria]
MRINMGFHLLHRKFLPCQSPEVGHGIGSVLHWINRKTRKHRRDIREKFGNTSEEFYSDESFSYQAPRHMEVIRSFSRRKRDYKNSQLRRSLRPRSHHARVEISRDLGYRHKRSDPIKHGKHGGIVHDIKVTQKSKFVHKGRKYREGLYQSQK